MQQSIQQLCLNLESMVDRFEGLAETTRTRSYDLFGMFKDSMDGRDCWMWHMHNLPEVMRYALLPGLLTDAGFYMLGRGHFSFVLGHDDQPDTAFKLSLKPEDSYVAYAMYCRQNPGRHLPEIRCMVRAVEAQIIAVKRYTPFSDASYRLGSGWEFPYTAERFLSMWREAEAQLRQIQEGSDRHLLIYTESFVDALVGIGRHFDGAATFDLHEDNLMFDPDTCAFIITDPVSFKKENSHVIERPRKNSDRTAHVTAEKAGSVAN